MSRRKQAIVTIAPEAKNRLRQIAKEHLSPMSTMLNQMILAYPVEHPENIKPVIDNAKEAGES